MQKERATPLGPQIEGRTLQRIVHAGTVTRHMRISEEKYAPGGRDIDHRRACPKRIAVRVAHHHGCRLHARSFPHLTSL